MTLTLSSAQAGPAPKSAAPAPAAADASKPANAAGDAKAQQPARPAAAASSPAASSDAPQDSGQRETEVYGDRLSGIQAEVDALKEKVFRSKARLAVLRETVLQGVMAGSRVVLSHRNLMGSGFRLTRVTYFLDGAQIFIEEDTSGALDERDEITIYDGNIVPGPHNVRVQLTYRGNGFGVFNYLRDYTFEVVDDHEFSAPKDGAVKLVSVGFEGGNISTQMQDRPSIDWQTVTLDAAGNPTKADKGRKAEAKGEVKAGAGGSTGAAKK